MKDRLLSFYIHRYLGFEQSMQWVCCRSEEGNEELRCVLAVVRHGDRTPKQKMKMKITQVNSLHVTLFTSLPQAAHCSTCWCRARIHVTLYVVYWRSGTTCGSDAPAQLHSRSRACCSMKLDSCCCVDAGSHAGPAS